MLTSSQWYQVCQRVDCLRGDEGDGAVLSLRQYAGGALSNLYLLTFMVGLLALLVSVSGLVVFTQAAPDIGSEVSSLGVYQSLASGEFSISMVVVIWLFQLGILLLLSVGLAAAYLHSDGLWQLVSRDGKRGEVSSREVAQLERLPKRAMVSLAIGVGILMLEIWWLWTGVPDEGLAGIEVKVSLVGLSLLSITGVLTLLSLWVKFRLIERAAGQLLSEEQALKQHNAIAE